LVPASPAQRGALPRLADTLTISLRTTSLFRAPGAHGHSSWCPEARYAGGHVGRRLLDEGDMLAHRTAAIRLQGGRCAGKLRVGPSSCWMQDLCHLARAFTAS